MLPFPILLDSDGKIQKTFGVSHWPTTILFDPEGKLVGEIQPEELEKKLKPVPLAVALPRKLDRNTNIYFDNPTLKEAIANLKTVDPRRVRARPRRGEVAPEGRGDEDPAHDQRAGLAPQLPGFAAGPGRPEVKVGPEGIHHHAETAGQAPPPAAARATSRPNARARINRKLKESKFTYDFDKTPLAKVAMFFEQQSTENVVLDPKGRMQGKIDPKTPVTGSGKDVPMGEALEKLVAPLGLRIVVRDEVIVLEAAAPRPVAAAAR